MRTLKPSPPALVTPGFVAEALAVTIPGSRWLLDRANIRPWAIARSGSGRLTKLYEESRVLRLAAFRVYRPRPPRARVAPKEK